MHSKGVTRLPPWPTLGLTSRNGKKPFTYKFVVSDDVSVHHCGRLTCPFPSSSGTCPFRPSRSPTSSSASARASPGAVRPVCSQRPRQRQVSCRRMRYSFQRRVYRARHPDLSSLTSFALCPSCLSSLSYQSSALASDRWFQFY